MITSASSHRIPDPTIARYPNATQPPAPHTRRSAPSARAPARGQRRHDRHDRRDYDRQNMARWRAAPHPREPTAQSGQHDSPDAVPLKDRLIGPDRGLDRLAGCPTCPAACPGSGPVGVRSRRVSRAAGRGMVGTGDPVVGEARDQLGLLVRQRMSGAIESGVGRMWAVRDQIARVRVAKRLDDLAATGRAVPLDLCLLDRLPVA